MNWSKSTDYELARIGPGRLVEALNGDQAFVFELSSIHNIGSFLSVLRDNVLGRESSSSNSELIQAELAEPRQCVLAISSPFLCIHNAKNQTLKTHTNAEQPNCLGKGRGNLTNVGQVVQTGFDVRRPKAERQFGATSSHCKSYTEKSQYVTDLSLSLSPSLFSFYPFLRDERWGYAGKMREIYK